MRILFFSTAWLAVVGTCVCILCGYRRWALVYLIAPAALLLALEYIAWPLLVPLWPSSWTAAMQAWWLIALAFIVAPLSRWFWVFASSPRPWLSCSARALPEISVAKFLFGGSSVADAADRSRDWRMRMNSHCRDGPCKANATPTALISDFPEKH